MTTPAHQFFVRQKITLMVNRYEVRAADPGGTEGRLLAFAQQKRMSFKEQVTFYADESRSRPLFSFKARQGLDVRAEHDVFDENGRTLGYFRKDFGASLLRSTWHLSAPGIDALGQERRPVIAILRRVWDFIPVVGDLWIPFVFHFDFTDKATGAPVLTSERQKTVRDRYTISVFDPPARLPGRRVDGRRAGRAAEPVTSFATADATEMTAQRSPRPRSYLLRNAGKVRVLLRQSGRRPPDGPVAAEGGSRVAR